jgi:hypothetical protein
MKERRWGIRKRVEFSVSLMGVGEVPQIVSAQAVDLGMGGLGLRCPVRLTVGMEWTAVFQIPGEEKKFKLAGKIVRVMALGEGKGYHLGFHFTESQKDELSRIANYLTGTFVLI